jgi:uncharacterized LabA/DUF88 family protein/cold shock CspA family protein
MLKAGIFLDTENLSHCGGWGMNVEILRRLCEAQGAAVVRANAYVAVDEQRERDPQNPDYGRKKQGFRGALRRAGFHVVTKPVRRWHNADGSTNTKADADIDIAVDAMLQAQNLDRILLGTGDGDFTVLVRALQSRGRRVDLVAFSNVAGELRREVDTFFDGYLIPGLLEVRGGSQRRRGVLHSVDEQRGFGFLTHHTGLGRDAENGDLFLHINDLESGRYNNEEFARLRGARDTYIEFDIDRSGDKPRAVRASVFRPLAEAAAAAEEAPAAAAEAPAAGAEAAVADGGGERD